MSAELKNGQFVFVGTQKEDCLYWMKREEVIYLIRSTVEGDTRRVGIYEVTTWTDNWMGSEPHIVVGSYKLVESFLETETNVNLAKARALELITLYKEEEAQYGFRSLVIPYLTGALLFMLSAGCGGNTRVTQLFEDTKKYRITIKADPDRIYYADSIRFADGLLWADGMYLPSNVVVEKKSQVVKIR